MVMFSHTPDCICCVDVGGTLQRAMEFDPRFDSGFDLRLAGALQSLKQPQQSKGTTTAIILATDGGNRSAARVVVELEQLGYAGLLDDYVTAETFGLSKSDRGYWTKVREHYRAPDTPIILIDDNQETLQAAKNEGILIVSALPEEKAIQQLIETHSAIVSNVGLKNGPA